MHQIHLLKQQHLYVIYVYYVAVHGMTETGVNMSPYDTTITYPKGTVGWPIGKGSAKVMFMLLIYHLVYISNKSLIIKK